MSEEKPYNPLDKRNLGESVAEALLARPKSKLPPITFDGAGVYALYYKGDFPIYRKFFESKKSKLEFPIYVGKAVPAGARKGGFGLGDEPGEVLSKRLREHSMSIEQVKNLKLADFYCRYLVVDDIWIPLGESLLIEMFKPLWNITIDGFGNHDPGSGRYKQQKSAWDLLHPGRSWAEKLEPSEKTAKEIIAQIESGI